MNSKESGRRRWGIVFLAVAGGMLVLGQTLLHPFLHNLAFVIFWLICFVAVGLAMLMALLDFRAISRQAREEQRDLVTKTLVDLRKGDESIPGPAKSARPEN
ncbi:MAG TPA: hypothetical protein VHH73_20635 [Verrucomicrobiae bacterium]|nr:hypothetical protein [Verrucomicrobiae bacterium]